MSPEETTALIALITGICLTMIVLGSVYVRRLRFREREMELRVRLAEAEASTAATGASQMEDRLRVLERIATDKGSSLSREIEALRESA